MTQDEQHLHLLSIFHFVVAGITFLFAMFPILHLAIGVAILSGAIPTSNGDGIPRFFGWFFVVFATTWIVCGLTLATLIALGGRALQRRRHYTFCLVVAGLSCLMMPIGTVLGVFTILVLMRESVKPLFEQPVRSASAGM